MIGIQIAYLFNTHGFDDKMFRAFFSAARGRGAFQGVALNTPSLSVVRFSLILATGDGGGNT
jgi:hypothetical protein